MSQKTPIEPDINSSLNGGDDAEYHAPPAHQKVKHPVRTILSVLGIIVIAVIGIGLGIFARVLRPGKGEAGVGTSTTLGQTLANMYQIVGDPREGFPGKSKILICCMGIDDNWTNSDEVFTTGARTDTLFLMSLDLTNKKVSILSIPRDSYVPIAGTDYATKINAAYSTGGPKRTEATIANWLGVTPDYYIVLNIDATRKLVDALGGVDVDVEHQMDYDDDWGQLHVHLKPGYQHLDGLQAVGFARFRHGNHGTSPEDGDERRMYRQHVLLRAMIAQAKKPANLVQFTNLVDTGMACIHTDLDRTQLLDLAKMFSGIDQDNDIQAVSLPGTDGHNRYGDYVMLIDPTLAKRYVQWIVGGDPMAGRALTPIRITNATTTQGLAAQAQSVLTSSGYTDSIVLGNSQLPNTTHTVIIDQGVPDKAAVQSIASSLGITDAQIINQPLQPNKNGWAPPPAVLLELGSDYPSAAPTGSQQTATMPTPASSS